MRRSIAAVLLVLFVAAATPGASLPEFGPYIQAVTGSSAVILWEGRDANRISLRLEGESISGTVSTRRDSVLIGSAWRPRSEAQIGNLSPGERIEAVFIGSDGKELPKSALSFTSAPRTGSATALFFGDSGTGSSAQKRIARLMDRMDADFILHSGDVVYEAGARSEYDERFFDIYRDLLRRAPFFPVLGNHDIRTDDGAPYLDVFRFPGGVYGATKPSHRGRYYSFRWGDAFFIALDSNVKEKEIDSSCGESRSVGRSDRYRRVEGTNLEKRDCAQFRWFVRALERAPGECWVVVVIHRPPLTSSWRKPSCGLLDALRTAESLSGRKIDVVLSGHEHDYQRSWPILLSDRDDVGDPASRRRRGGVWNVRHSFDDEEGTLFVVSGGGGGKQRLRPSPDLSAPWIAAGKKRFHFTQIVFDSRQFLIQAIDDSGEMFDQVRLVR